MCAESCQDAALRILTANTSWFEVAGYRKISSFHIVLTPLLYAGLHLYMKNSFPLIFNRLKSNSFAACVLKCWLGLTIGVTCACYSSYWDSQSSIFW
jgi:hypothetical protein